MVINASAELQHARNFARQAGRLAMQHYGRATATYKAENSPVTEADHAANDCIVTALREAFPADAILSEESKDSDSRLTAERVWIVDPLDGTKEFIAQNGEFSVMIGFAVRQEPVLGVVYVPVTDTLYYAQHGQGAWVERSGKTERLDCHAENGGDLRMVGSRSHSDPLLLQMQEALGVVDVKPSGSVGIKCALIAECERDVYIHPVPYLKEWDTCAPEVILREAGGTVTDCMGEPLRYNKPDPVQPHGIIACAGGAMQHVLDCIKPLYVAAKSELQRA